MRDAAFILLEVGRAGEPQAPFTYDYTVTRTRTAFWYVRDVTGRKVARSLTRAGARAAVRALWAQQAERLAA